MLLRLTTFFGNNKSSFRFRRFAERMSVNLVLATLRFERVPDAD